MTINDQSVSPRVSNQTTELTSIPARQLKRYGLGSLENKVKDVSLPKIGMNDSFDSINIY